MYLIQIKLDNQGRLIDIMSEGSKRVYYSANAAVNSIDLVPGEVYKIETPALTEPLIVERIYTVSAHWMNYTKANPPQLVMNITEAFIVADEVTEPATAPIPTN